MLAFFRAVCGSYVLGQVVASVDIYGVKKSNQRAAYGSPKINTTMRTSPCNVRSLWVNRVVVACTASVDGSIFCSVGGTRCAAK